MPLRFSRVAAGVLVATLALTACRASPSEEPPDPSPTADSAYACPPGDLLIETLPSDQSLLETRSVDYSAECENQARLTVSAARDGGTTSFVNGLVHIAGADTPLDAQQAQQAEVRCLQHPAWHLPIMADPVALVYRLDGVEDLTLRPGTLAKMFSGVITQWNDPEIAADNPTASLPDARIEVFFRAGRTGATQALGDYLNRQAAEAWPVGGTPAWRGGGQSRGSAQEVFDAVQSTPQAIGYVEQSQLPRAITSPTPTPTPTPPATSTQAPTATPSPTPTVTPTGPGTPQLLRLEQGAGPVELTAESAQRGIDGLRGPAQGHDLVLDAADAASGWPIARVSYQILCSAGQRADLAPLERDWVTYLVDDDVQAELGGSGLIALSPELRERVRAAAQALS